MYCCKRRVVQERPGSRKTKRTGKCKTSVPAATKKGWGARALTKTTVHRTIKPPTTHTHTHAHTRAHTHIHAHTYTHTQQTPRAVEPKQHKSTRSSISKGAPQPLARTGPANKTKRGNTSGRPTEFELWTWNRKHRSEGQLKSYENKTCSN